METNSKPLRDQLPVTTSVGVTEASFKVFGLNGFGFAYVFGAFILGAFVLNQFPVGVVCAIAMWIFIRRMVDGKPRNYLIHLARYYLVIPRWFTHRPGR